MLFDVGKGTPIWFTNQPSIYNEFMSMFRVEPTWIHEPVDNADVVLNVIVDGRFCVFTPVILNVKKFDMSKLQLITPENSVSFLNSNIVCPSDTYVAE